MPWRTFFCTPWRCRRKECQSFDARRGLGRSVAAVGRQTGNLPGHRHITISAKFKRLRSTVLPSYLPAVCLCSLSHDCRFDTIAFGHNDGFVASLAVQAFGAIAEMKTQLGDAAGAAAAAHTFGRGAAAYTRVYWSEEYGVFSDWVDASGRRRDYFFTVSADTFPTCWCVLGGCFAVTSY
eukprot:SAG22_NODE_341_length_11992_cov_180.308753_3_plen_180_part_00